MIVGGLEVAPERPTVFRRGPSPVGRGLVVVGASLGSVATTRGFPATR